MTLVEGWLEISPPHKIPCNGRLTYICHEKYHHAKLGIFPLVRAQIAANMFETMRIFPKLCGISTAIFDFHTLSPSPIIWNSPNRFPSQRRWTLNMASSDRNHLGMPRVVFTEGPNASAFKGRRHPGPVDIGNISGKFVKISKIYQTKTFQNKNHLAPVCFCSLYFILPKKSHFNLQNAPTSGGWTP